MKSVLRQLALLILTAAIPASASAWLQWERGKWDQFRDYAIQISELAQIKQRILWVDARSSEEFVQDHIPGAVRLTEDDWNELLPDLLNSWDPGCRVIVYCNSGKCHASRDVAKRLREEVGLTNVYVLRGGWEAWKGAPR